MSLNLVYYRLRTTVKFLEIVNHAMETIKDELIDHSLDPIRVKRRYRMLRQLSLYQTQILSKIPNFRTDDLRDFRKFLETAQSEIDSIINRGS